MDFAGLEQCIQLREDMIAKAVSSSSGMNALLARFQQIAAPKKGAPTILLALARMATTACDWIDGELILTLTGDDSTTKISVLSDLGGGLRERVLKDVTLRVPLDEFVRAINKTPTMIAPLVTREIGKRIVLSATQEIRRTSLPPAVEIDTSSLVIIEMPKAPTPKIDESEQHAPPLRGSLAKSATPVTVGKLRPATLPGGKLPVAIRRAPAAAPAVAPPAATPASTEPVPALVLRTPPNPLSPAARADQPLPAARPGPPRPTITKKVGKKPEG